MPPAPPTAADAQAFIEEAESRLDVLNTEANRAGWIQETYITDDTEIVAAQAQSALSGAVTELVRQARQFERVQMPDDLARKFARLRLWLTAPTPSNPSEREEMTRLIVSLDSEYGKGTYCRPKNGQQERLGINAIARILATSRNPDELRDLWIGWHTVGAPMRDRYARFVELSNRGAREMGFPDPGAMWRSNYDMAPDRFAAEIERLWQQVRPLYLSLHAYVRSRLEHQYGAGLFPGDGTIPAHLLGNMWAQEWSNVYPIVAPADAAPTHDLTAILRARQTDEHQMVRYAERFFTSLGFAPLPATFWSRSLFRKPADRDVVCHASAWDIDGRDDVRLKMCVEITAEDFVTAHHELGHDFYYRAYSGQPFLFQSGANDGFHEAIGDAMALSATSGYLNRIGLLEHLPPPGAEIGDLLRQALFKIAFLPFGLLVDRWRWKVFSGEVTPAGYNEAWWELRRRYQGVSPPVPRTEEDFDPGAKYHVPANTPYARYFLAHILQFQFHRALCRIAGETGPLHRCSVHGNKDAGARLNRMLEMGASKPWPDALEVLTAPPAGAPRWDAERQMDASAILEYFAPLKTWLDDQNKGVTLGWEGSGDSGQ